MKTDDRLQAVRAALATIEAPPELANLYSRLETLAYESEALLPDIDLPPNKVVAPAPDAATEVLAADNDGAITGDTAA